MKPYTVEFKRTSYVTLYIDAESADHAEELAWQELQSGESYGISDDADWETTSIDEHKVSA
jgi:hypothetical protein